LILATCVLQWPGLMIQSVDSYTRSRSVCTYARTGERCQVGARWGVEVHNRCLSWRPGNQYAAPACDGPHSARLEMHSTQSRSAARGSTARHECIAVQHSLVVKATLLIAESHFDIRHFFRSEGHRVKRKCFYAQVIKRHTAKAYWGVEV
jgi:hypothetical protein